MLSCAAPVFMPCPAWSRVARTSSTMSGLSAVLTPRQRTYVSRMQGHPERSMFRPEFYMVTDLPCELLRDMTGDAATSEVLLVDKHLHDSSLFTKGLPREKNNVPVFHNVGSVPEMENSSDLTLVNSTFISSDGGSEDASLLQVMGVEFSEPQVGSKRRMEQEDDEIPEKRFKLAGGSVFRELRHHQHYISSDFISSEDVEILTPDMQSTSQYEYTQLLSQLKSSQFTPFPLYTAQDISHAVLSSFDPIFSSES